MICYWDLKKIKFNDTEFRISNLIRLQVLKNHITSGRLNNLNLEFVEIMKKKDR